MRFGKTAFAVLTVGLLSLACAEGASAQVSLTNTGASYTQNFDTLSAAGSQATVAFANNTTLQGLYARQFGASTGTPTAYRSDDGTATFGALFSYGTGTQTDRALGTLAANAPGAFEYGFRFKNDGTTNITGFTLRYTGEQWRDASTSTQKLLFSYSVFSSGTTGDIGNETNSTPGTYARDSRYTADTALDFTSPSANSSTGVATNGNAPAFRTVGITDTVTGLTVAKGDELWVRWVDLNDTGNDHALAIDDLSLTASFAPADTPEPASLVLLGGAGVPIGALWIRSRRRK